MIAVSYFGEKRELIYKKNILEKRSKFFNNNLLNPAITPYFLVPCQYAFL